MTFCSGTYLRIFPVEVKMACIIICFPTEHSQLKVTHARAGKEVSSGFWCCCAQVWMVLIK
jgi:hypothetical protein